MLGSYRAGELFVFLMILGCVVGIEMVKYYAVR